MLTILTGRAASGKTTRLLARMREAGAERPQLLLVPEQASFETERRFCAACGDGASAYGEVLSFTRLESRLAGAGEVLDEGGRVLVLWAALRSVRDVLTAYAMPSQRPEFLNGLLTTLDELKSCCVSADDLVRIGEETEGLDGEKLRDLGLVLGAYEARTARGPLDPRDRLTRLAERLRDHRYFLGKDVYLDGFTDFTPQQGLVLEQILRQAHSVTVALTSGGGSGEEEVFAPAHRTAAWLRRLAAKAGRAVREEVQPGAARGRPAPLAHLERGLFAQEVPPYDGPWDGSVAVTAQPTRRDEVRWAAGTIRRLVRTEGLRWRDFAVCARSMDGYWDHIEGVFAAYGIPVFQSEMSDILQKPIFTLLTAAMDAVSGGYRYEDMFRYLKTGLAGVGPDECDRLENYVLTWDIHGSRWTAASGWTRHPGGYHKTFTERDEQELAALEALRRRVIAPLEELRRTAGETVRSQVLALYRFLERIEVPRLLEERTARLLERGEPELAREYSQLWDILCAALVQCEAMVGEVPVGFSEFARLLRLLLSRYRVGSIPASLDRVTAGDAPRLSGRRCRVLILLGADDGSIPQVSPGQGLLTDRDRALLEDYGLELAPRMEDRLCREHTIVYTACAQPSDRLYVTWPNGGGERPSYLIGRLTALFPACRGAEPPAPAPDELRALAVRRPTLRAALGDDALIERLDRAQRTTRGRLSPAAVRQLYGRQVAMSASRMDQYGSCHFAYFLRYGLDVQARRPAGFDAPEYGTFVHFVLEHVLRAVRDGGGITAHTDEAVADLARAAVRTYVQTVLGGWEHQSPRARYLFRRLERNVLAVVENVTAELRASDFQPLCFELGFGSGKDLPPVTVHAHGIDLRVSGFVDRIDGWEQDGRLYLRVVDYKTGRKSFDLTEVWNGLGLQLLLYLFALEDEGAALFGTRPVPAGALYLPAREAMAVGERDMDPAERQRQLDKALRRHGLILDDPAVAAAMERPEGGIRFLPLKVSARTGTIGGEALVSAERLGRLKRHTQRILEDICAELAAGNVDADPFWRGPQRNACQYCDYFQACQFEEGRDHRRWIPTMSNGAFWESLERGGEDDGDPAHD